MTLSDTYDMLMTLDRAEGLLRGDFIGTTDPYIKVAIPSKPYPTYYTSKVVKRSRNPVWQDERLLLRNIPPGAEFTFNLFDKDYLTAHDDLGSAFYTFNPSTDKADEKNVALQLNTKGTLFISIGYVKSNYDGRARLAGPIRYSQRCSRTAGMVVGTINDDGPVYPVWKVYLCDIPYYFDNVKQHWNEKYDKAQAIFKNRTIRSGITQQHAFIYKHHNVEDNGELESAADFFSKLNYGKRQDQMRYFTYVIMETDWRFSETGANFLMDMVSKHAMHSGAAEEVFYAGEFCIVEEKEGYKLVIDNNSGTYAPHPDGLAKLQQLLQANFPGMKVETVDVSVQAETLKVYHSLVPSRSRG